MKYVNSKEAKTAMGNTAAAAQLQGVKAGERGKEFGVDAVAVGEASRAAAS